MSDGFFDLGVIGSEPVSVPPGLEEEDGGFAEEDEFPALEDAPPCESSYVAAPPSQKLRGELASVMLAASQVFAAVTAELADQLASPEGAPDASVPGALLAGAPAPEQPSLLDLLDADGGGTDVAGSSPEPGAVPAEAGATRAAPPLVPPPTASRAPSARADLVAGASDAGLARQRCLDASPDAGAVEGDVLGGDIDASDDDSGALELLGAPLAPDGDKTGAPASEGAGSGAAGTAAAASTALGAAPAAGTALGAAPAAVEIGSDGRGELPAAAACGGAAFDSVDRLCAAAAPGREEAAQPTPGSRGALAGHADAGPGQAVAPVPGTAAVPAPSPQPARPQRRALRQRGPTMLSMAEAATEAAAPVAAGGAAEHAAEEAAAAKASREHAALREREEAASADAVAWEWSRICAEWGIVAASSSQRAVAGAPAELPGAAFDAVGAAEAPGASPPAHGDAGMAPGTQSGSAASETPGAATAGVAAAGATAGGVAEGSGGARGTAAGLFGGGHQDADDAPPGDDWDAQGPRDAEQVLREAAEALPEDLAADAQDALRAVMRQFGRG